MVCALQSRSIIAHARSWICFLQDDEESGSDATERDREGKIEETIVRKREEEEQVN